MQLLNASTTKNKVDYGKLFLFHYINQMYCKKYYAVLSVRKVITLANLALVST